jgi:hypothetical protein
VSPQHFRLGPARAHSDASPAKTMWHPGPRWLISKARRPLLGG